MAPNGLDQLQDISVGLIQLNILLARLVDSKILGTAPLDAQSVHILGIAIAMQDHTLDARYNILPATYDLEPRDLNPISKTYTNTIIAKHSVMPFSVDFKTKCDTCRHTPKNRDSMYKAENAITIQSKSRAENNKQDKYCYMYKYIKILQYQ